MIGRRFKIELNLILVENPVLDDIELQLTDGLVTWDPVPGATGYDVVRGDLRTLRETGGNFFLATDSCILAGLPLTSVSQGLPPLPGEGTWYLTRKRDAIGKGTYDSGSSFQVDLRDDEIAGSGDDCP